MNPLEPLTRLFPASLRTLLAPPAPEQVRRLAGLLGIEPAELAAVRMGPRYHYRPFTLAKRDGRERRILAPSPALKQLQRRLLDQYLYELPVHPFATAFRPDFSIVENARLHAYATVVATVDLRDFFESTSASRVRRFFARQGWQGEALAALMRLCVYRNGLPQGAPTSPCLSNLVNVSLDGRLHQLAAQSQGYYTRYGDDLTFSWRTGTMPGGFQAAVEDHVRAAGYEIQPCKGWRVSSIRERPRVTGLVLAGNGRLRVPWALRWHIWRLRWRSWWSGEEGAAARLAGYAGFLRMVR